MENEIAEITVESSLVKAKKLAKPCLQKEDETDQAYISQVSVTETKKELVTVIPIEGNDTKDEIRNRVELFKYLTKDPSFQERYEELSMEILGWRDDNGLPKLVPFSLSNPWFRMANEMWSWAEHVNFKISVPLPSSMLKMYRDIEEVCQKNHKRDRAKMSTTHITMTTSTKFSGVIPQWVRDTIAKAENDFLTPGLKAMVRRIFKPKKTKFENIFMIAEVEDWKKETVVFDPIVVGYKAGRLWVICSFDETPLEEYARREFRV